MSHRVTLGFDRRLEVSWLDAAAAVAVRGDPPAVARATLYALLEGVVAGVGPHSGRGKTVTVLMRIWFNPSPRTSGLRRRALDLLEGATPSERLAIHWAMCCGTHPFFADTAAATGRLLRIQGNASLSQIVRRVAEKWGDRSTLRRAVPRICRCFVAWGVLEETSTRNVYEPARCAVGSRAACLLVEGLLLGGDQEALPFPELVRHHALFPFDLDIGVAELRAAREFRVDRHGLDLDAVRLSENEARPQVTAHGERRKAP